jgi:hypothetical protein
MERLRRQISIIFGEDWYAGDVSNHTRLTGTCLSAVHQSTTSNAAGKDLSRMAAPGG